MELRFKRRFFKDLERLAQADRRRVEEVVFQQLPQLTSLNEATNVVKIKGYSAFFRIRVGNLRIGLQLRDSIVVVMRVLDRKSIYRYFP